MKTTIPQAHPLDQSVPAAKEIGTHDTLGEDEVLSRKNSNHEEQNSPDQAQKGNSSLLTVAFNIINTAIGGGILGYPYIMRQMGVVTGILMVIIGGVLTCFSASILLKVKNLCGKSEYIAIAEACFKKFGRILAEVIIVFNTLGGCIIYLVVFTTVVQNILGAFVESCMPNKGSISFYCRPSLITIFGALIILPFNFMKDIGKLKAVGIVKVISIFIFTGITIAFALHKACMGELDSDVEMFPNFQEPVAMLASIPQIIFGFNFLYNQFSLYNSMKERSDAKFNKTVYSSITFVGLVYIAVGVCGYLIYGSSTDNMLQNFKKEDLGSVWFSVLNVAFLVCSLGGIPVTFFPAREILYDSILRHLAKRRSHDSYTRIDDDRSINLAAENRDSSPSQPQKNKKVFVSLVLITNALIVLIAIVAPGLNQVLGVIGSIGSSGLMFLFPMAFYLLLTRGKEISKVVPIIVIAFGVVVAISGFTTNLMKMFSS